MNEKKLEKSLVFGIKRLGGLCLKFWCVSFTGFPDRMILMPGGRIYFAEVKTTGKKPTKRQEAVHAILKRLGFYVTVVSDERELIGFLSILKCLHEI